jgi:peptidoglycan/LPS O-acetylase OafA/YrhL
VSLQEIALIAGIAPATTHKPPPPARDFWHASYFPPLDGLRALSVLLVIGGHARTAVPLKRYLSGGLGVGVFFVLSGFLITTLLLREELATGSISFGGFYIRRFFRIFPPYFLTVGVYLLIGFLPSQHELKTKVLNGLPYFLSLRNEYVPPGLEVAFTHSWSLSVEEKFYFLWPVIFFLALRKLKARWAVIPITLIPLLISTSATLPVAYFSLLSGACGAIALHALRTRQGETLNWVNRIPLTPAIILWFASYVLSFDGAFRISFIIVTAAMIPLLLLRETWLSRLLGSNICMWVGKRTYSMYLFHALVLTAIEEHVLHPTTSTRYLAVVGLVYLSALGFASVSYLVLEKPCMSWGRELSERYARTPVVQDRIESTTSDATHATLYELPSFLNDS